AITRRWISASSRYGSTSALIVVISFSPLSRSRNVRRLACIRNLWTIRRLLNGSGAGTHCSCGRLAETLLDFIVSDLGGFGDVRLVRLAKRRNKLERLRIADAREDFKQPGVDARRVVGALQKWVKNVRAFQF